MKAGRLRLETSTGFVIESARINTRKRRIRSWRSTFASLSETEKLVQANFSGFRDWHNGGPE